MNGQTKKSKREIVNEYIARVNPYEKQKALSFDLRGYAAYIAENGIKASEITPEIMNKFSKA